MKVIMLTVGVEDNEFPEGGVLLQCPENSPNKQETPFLLMTPRSDGIAIERINDLREIAIRGERFDVKEVEDGMWNFVYECYKHYKITSSWFFLDNDNFDFDLIFHILLGFNRAAEIKEVKESKPVAQ